MSDRLRSKEPPRFLAAAVTAFMAVGLAGCGNDEDERYVYCIDDSGEVVDPDYCEREEYQRDDQEDPEGYWYYVSRRRYSIGLRVPSDHLTSRIRPSDPTARANAGLPQTGGIGGTTLRSGGFGSGSSYDGSGGG